MKYTYIILCVILCISAGCSGPAEGKNTEQTSKGTDKGLDLQVGYKFLGLEAGEKGLPILGIVCTAKVPIQADIGYQVGNKQWIPIQTGLKSELKQGTNAVMYRWEKPISSDNIIIIKVTVLSSDGKKESKTITVDCVKPVSKATFNPFSL